VRRPGDARLAVARAARTPRLIERPQPRGCPTHAERAETDRREALRRTADSWDVCHPAEGCTPVGWRRVWNSGWLSGRPGSSRSRRTPDGSRLSTSRAGAGLRHSRPRGSRRAGVDRIAGVVKMGVHHTGLVHLVVIEPQLDRRVRCHPSTTPSPDTPPARLGGSARFR
jgi:hypothetical protein